MNLTKNVPQSSIAVRFGVGSHLIRGEVGVSDFWITRNMGRNSWRVKFNGHLVSEGKRTRIDGQFSVLPITELGMSCMVISIAIFVLFIWAYSIYDLFWGQYHNNWLGGLQQYLPFLLIYLLFFVFVRGFQLAGRNSMEDDEKYLFQFLEKTIGAK